MIPSSRISLGDGSKLFRVRPSPPLPPPPPPLPFQALRSHSRVGVDEIQMQLCPPQSSILVAHVLEGDPSAAQKHEGPVLQLFAHAHAHAHAPNRLGERAPPGGQSAKLTLRCWLVSGKINPCSKDSFEPWLVWLLGYRVVPPHQSVTWFDSGHRAFTWILLSPTPASPSPSTV